MNEVKSPQTTPSYMREGSRGPAVNLLAAFFKGRGDAEGMRTNGIYSHWLAQRMRLFQMAHNLEQSGCLDPETKDWLENGCGFDFDEAARTSGGTTVFVQPDGTEISWAPLPSADVGQKTVSSNYQQADTSLGPEIIN